MKTKFAKRPWGSFEQFVKDKSCTVKIHTILPNRKNSLQFHKKRSEFWKILKGFPIITISKKVTKAKEGDEFFIPKNEPHRFAAQKTAVKILEISFGEFNEKDIIRLEDDYGRT